MWKVLDGFGLIDRYRDCPGNP
jgi:hypothetical protein